MRFSNILKPLCYSSHSIKEVKIKTKRSKMASLHTNKTLVNVKTNDMKCVKLINIYQLTEENETIAQNC